MNQSEQKIRCQSCGMPMEDWFFGTDSSDQITKEYCRFCYVKGQFTEPELTVDQMIQRNMDFMTRKLKIAEEKSREFSYALIPTLSRWRK
jgi:hypothetical protein